MAHTGLRQNDYAEQSHRSEPRDDVLSLCASGGAPLSVTLTDMERPWQILNEEQWDGLRAEVCRTASGILDGSVDLITGARQLASLSHEVHADEDPDFIAFIGIDSETDVFPLGPVRQHWNSDALAKYDLERERAEQKYRSRALECARRLLTKYAQKI